MFQESLICRRFLLSQHPEVEAKVVQELQSLGLAASPKNPHPRELTYADLAELVYLQAVVKVPLQNLYNSHLLYGIYVHVTELCYDSQVVEEWHRRMETCGGMCVLALSWLGCDAGNLEDVPSCGDRAGAHRQR